MNLLTLRILGVAGLTIVTCLTASAQGGPYQSPVDAVLGGPAQLATQPSDTASNYSGSGNYTSDNNGTGFKTAFQASGQGGTFLGDSNVNGGNSNGTSINDSSGKAFGLYGPTESATRDFTNPLTIGETFHISFDNGNIENGQAQQYQLTSTGSPITFYFLGGQKYYNIADAYGSTLTTIPYTTGGLDTSLTLTGPTSYTFNSTSLADGYTYTYNGTFNGSLTGLKVTNNNPYGGDLNNLYFNKLSVDPAPAPVPEPASSVSLLIGAALLGGVIMVRRQRQTRPA